MFRKPLFFMIIVLAVTALSCNFVNNLPITRVQTGPTRTEDISVPLPDDPETVYEIELGFGAGRLQLSPGAENALISGTATYNVDDFKPEIALSTEGNQVHIFQNTDSFQGIPVLDSDLENEWDLKLGDTPISLRINAGAYQGQFELGGLSIQELHVSDGAADAELAFSSPNQVEMSTLRYETGASSVKLSGLANANFSDLIFKGGAGDYELEFSGDLQRDASISIDAGLGSVRIIVPEGVAADLSFDGSLTNIKTSGSWSSSGGSYTTSGEGPGLHFTVNMGAGNLELETR